MARRNIKRRRRTGFLGGTISRPSVGWSPNKYIKPPSLKTTTPASLQKAMHSVAKRHFDRLKDEQYEKVAGHITKIATDQAIKIGNKVFDKVFEPTTATTSGGGQTPMMMTSSSGSMTDPGTMLSKKQHHTKIETGKPIPRVLKLAAKQFGTKKKVLYDTMFLTPEGRGNKLDHSCGFNSQNLWLPGYNSNISVNDIVEATNTNTLDVASNSENQKALLSVMHTQSEFKIYNQSAYFPIYVKFHVFTQEPNDAQPNPSVHMLNSTFSNTLEGQRNDAIPVVYQHQQGLQIGKADYSLKTKLTDSPWFRDNTKIVKTVTKKLEPGETWFLKHKHHCGSGVDFFALRSIYYPEDTNNQRAIATPHSYFYGFEVKGQACEGIFRPADVDSVASPLQTYLGTSPGWYMCEYKKSLEYILAVNQAEFNITPLDGVRDLCHMRAWTNDPIEFVNSEGDTREREFYVLPSDISSTRSSLGEGKMYVPVMSDKLFVDSTTASQHGDDI